MIHHPVNIRLFDPSINEIHVCAKLVEYEIRKLNDYRQAINWEFNVTVESNQYFREWLHTMFTNEIQLILNVITPLQTRIWNSAKIARYNTSERMNKNLYHNIRILA